jgi:hypothetical protein
MILGDLVVVLVVVAACASIVAWVSSARSRTELIGAGPAQWQAGHHTAGSNTEVCVELVRTTPRGSEVLERRILGSVANDDPGYERLLFDLLEAARERAVLLEINRNPD